MCADESPSAGALGGEDEGSAVMRREMERLERGRGRRPAAL